MIIHPLDIPGCDLNYTFVQYLLLEFKKVPFLELFRGQKDLQVHHRLITSYFQWRMRTCCEMAPRLHLLSAQDPMFRLTMPNQALPPGEQEVYTAERIAMIGAHTAQNSLEGLEV